MQKVRDVERLNAAELEANVPLSGSWHQAYRASNYVFVGGLARELTEGDLETLMSQFGVVTDLRLQRDGETGESKGYGWVAFADWRSTVLAVDNMNGAEVVGRKLGVDHALNYRPEERKEGERTWWEEKMRAARKKEKKEKKARKEQKKKRRVEEEERRGGGGGLMKPNERLAKGDDGSVFIKKE